MTDITTLVAELRDSVAPEDTWTAINAALIRRAADTLETACFLLEKADRTFRVVLAEEAKAKDGRASDEAIAAWHDVMDAIRGF